MKSFGSYISKYLVSFVAFILILLFLNAVVFGLTSVSYTHLTLPTN